MRWTAMIALAVTLGAALPGLHAQAGKPPLEGDALLDLIGQHRRAAIVRSVLAWGGPGIDLRFQGDRVSGVRLRVAPGEAQHAFPGALPGGLPREATREQVKANPGWSDAGGGVWVHRFSTRWNEQPIDGFEIRVRFEGATLSSVEILNDAAEVFAQKSRAIQQRVPASTFQAAHWSAALGADIASELGALVTAWVGWSAGNATAERVGLGLRVRDGSWIEELVFAPAFEGARPFDLGGGVTAPELEPQLGAPDANADGTTSWHLVLPGSAPCDLVLIEGDAGTTIALRCDPAQAQAWQRIVQEDTPLPDNVVGDLAQVWRLLRADFESLKGAQQRQQGLLGTTTWWRCTKPLGGLLGGTVHESPQDDPFRSRSVRYLLRRCPEAEGRTARTLLATLEPQVAAILGEGWILDRKEAARGQPEASVWIDPEDDPFGGSATARLTAARIQGGYEVWMELSFPLEE